MNTDTPHQHESDTANCWMERIGISEICQNCGSDCKAAFCSTCGQRRIQERLKFGELSKDVFTRVLNLETGLLHTFLQLCVRPGGVAKDYCEGKQRCYVNPLTYFFLGAAAQLVSLWLVESKLRALLQQQFAAAQAQNAANERLEQALGQGTGEALADAYILSVQQGYTYAALLFFSVPLAVLLKVFHGLLGSQYRLGETMVFSLYVTGQMLLITAIATPIVLLVIPQLQVVVGPLAYLAITMQAHRPFFQAGWAPRILTGLALFLSVGIFMASILAIFIGTFTIQSVLAVYAHNAGQ